jgi:nucleoside 2-deoxyribosyltransferase
MRIFFAGPLTNLKEPDKTKALYNRIDELALQLGFETFWAFKSGTDPVKNPNVDPQYIYDKDLAELEKSNLMVAYIDEPTTGTGQELEFAREHNIPIYLIYRKGNHVSRMVVGNRGVDGIIEYTSDDNAIQKLGELLRGILRRTS